MLEKEEDLTQTARSIARELVPFAALLNQRGLNPV